MVSAVELRGISKTYEGSGTLAIEDVSFEVRPGEFLCIVGPSGCGKSTLLKIVGGLIQPSSGEVYLYGSRSTGPRTDLGMIPQSPSLLDWRTVMGNIMLPVEILDGDREEFRKKANELIKTVGLGGFEDRYPFELSGGMQQRVSICRALIYEPKLILADEPFASLDAFTRRRMAVEFTRIWEQYKREIVFVTHDIAEAIFLGDRVIVMSSRPGRVVDDIVVRLPRPRDQALRTSLDFTEQVAKISELITGQQTEDASREA